MAALAYVRMSMSTRPDPRRGLDSVLPYRPQLRRSNRRRPHHRPPGHPLPVAPKHNRGCCRCRWLRWMPRLAPDMVLTFEPPTQSCDQTGAVADAKGFTADARSGFGRKEYGDPLARTETVTTTARITDARAQRGMTPIRGLRGSDVCVL